MIALRSGWTLLVVLVAAVLGWLAGTDDVAPLRPARPDALGREAT